MAAAIYIRGRYATQFLFQCKWVNGSSMQGPHPRTAAATAVRGSHTPKPRPPSQPLLSHRLYTFASVFVLTVVFPSSDRVVAFPGYSVARGFPELIEWLLPRLTLPPSSCPPFPPNPLPAPWCLVPGAWCLLAGSWSLASGPWSMVPGAWCLFPGSLVPGPCSLSLLAGAWCLVAVRCSLVIGRCSMLPGPWCVAPGLWSLVSAPWLMIPGAWCLVTVHWSAPGPWSLVPDAGCLLVKRYGIHVETT
jgi:hypothetical protein